MDENAPRNRLAEETSPYLLQHAGNPVDWYPWGPDALEKARAEGKPILLSVGYAACHWCHVMAHESFEDEDVARRMSERFVCIKVDREERPDLDHIYQLAHQLLTGRPGGWPLTMFLFPDGRPFFGGTYFPKESRGGMPGFIDLLDRVADLWAQNRGTAEELGRRLAGALASVDAAPPGAPGAPLDRAPLDAAVRSLARNFDPLHGGLRGAPKFPQAAQLELLFRRHAAAPDEDTRRMLTLTLDRMARGGLFDQLGGGFFRYSTDERWLIPHFEKMLYDNALLLVAYVDGVRAFGDDLYRRTAVATAEWMLREMRTPEGAFASSLDADAEGEEGGFYVWRWDEVRALLLPEELAVAEFVFDLSRRGNFDERNHLYLAASAADTARQLGLAEDEVSRRLESARRKLLDARARRPRPGIDDKVLTAWNGLAIKALARAGRVLDRPDFVDAACAAADFLRSTLWRDGRLLATFRAGQAKLDAYLDDHAFLLDALLELLQARWRTRDLDWAVELADVLLDHFEDREAGGFFFTGDDHETLIHRTRSATDSALPSGNGIAALALQRLGWLLGNTRYLDAAERTLRGFAGPLADTPLAFTTLLGALDEHLTPGRIAVLRGDDATLGPWRNAIDDGSRPSDLGFVIPPGETLPEALRSKQPQGDAVAYVCEGPRCSAPLVDPAAFRAKWRPSSAAS